MEKKNSLEFEAKMGRWEGLVRGKWMENNVMIISKLKGKFSKNVSAGSQLTKQAGKANCQVSGH